MKKTKIAAIVSALSLMACCEPTQWEGVPADRVCSRAANHSMSTCIAGGQAYSCVKRDSDHMLCVRVVAEIRCVSLTNAETVCPEKK